MSEGFGLTDAEALACGTPVVAQDFSATHDVVGPGGILVPVARYFTTARMVDFGLPDLDEVFRALDRLYQDTTLRAKLAAAGIAHARRYDWDSIAEGFYSRFEAVLSRRRGERGESPRDEMISISSEPRT
jgi:glycosyltransferase involved in cell wall biosynthesis